MKNNITYNIILKSFAVLFFFTIASCNEDYLDVKQEDSYTLETAYQNDKLVENSTNSLYCNAWFDFYNGPYHLMLEISSGNMTGFDPGSFGSLVYRSTDSNLLGAWKGLYSVVAQSNAVLINLPKYVGPNVTQSVTDNALGEAHFMRALAYFYLVRLYGPVPIIENSYDFFDNYNVPPNTTASIYAFIENDLIEASKLLKTKVRTSDYASNARVSSGSAKAMLAKVYLYQNKFTLSKNLAMEVINSGEFKLLGGPELSNKSFGDLYSTANNNNEETVAAIQWVTGGGYSAANYSNTLYAGSSSLTAATYNGVYAPSQDLMKTAFEIYELNGVTYEDKRRKETYMIKGDKYDYLQSKQGSSYDTAIDEAFGAQNSGAGIKKYVVGRSSKYAGDEDPENHGYANNTYLMRYSEVFLILAEAILAGNSSTSDPDAINAVNVIRKRAGLLGYTTKLTDLQLLKERRAELAFEGEYWFDLCRFDRSSAVDIILSQNRGTIVNSYYVTSVSSSSFIFPIPAFEVQKNPRLNDTPVTYTNK